jgi:dTDP-4-dehydrorhamnose reductase
VYGRSKAEAEARVLEAHPAALVVRSGPLFGPWDEDDFVTVALRHLASGRRLVVADDSVTSPTYVPDVVHAALDLLIDGERGRWHLANAGEMTRAALVQRAAELVGVDARGLQSRPTRVVDRGASRPPHHVLGTERGEHLSTLDVALANYVQDRQTALGSAMISAA